MKEFSLPRSGDAPLTFRGELIVSQDFTEDEELYLDQEGTLQTRKHACIMNVSLYRTDDGCFVYHNLDRTKPQVKPPHAIARFETQEEHKRSLASMEDLRRCGCFKPGPLRLGTA